MVFCKVVRQPSDVSCFRKTHMNTILVGGIPSPLKNDGVRQPGMIIPNWMESHKIHVPVTTNQYLFAQIFTHIFPYIFLDYMVMVQAPGT